MMYNLNGSLHARFAVLFSNGNIIILNTKIGLMYNLGIESLWDGKIDLQT